MEVLLRTLRTFNVALPAVYARGVRFQATASARSPTAPRQAACPCAPTPISQARLRADFGAYFAFLVSYMPLASQRKKSRIARVTRRAPAKSFVSGALRLWDNDPATTLLLSTAKPAKCPSTTPGSTTSTSPTTRTSRPTRPGRVEEAGRRASKAQAKECVEAWWQACPKQSSVHGRVRGAAHAGLGRRRSTIIPRGRSRASGWASSGP